MLTRYFDWREDTDTGAGWCPRFLGDRAGVGFYLAHDVLEHRPGDDPTFHQEVMAFGRMVYTRGIQNWFDDGGFPLGMEIFDDQVLRELHWETDSVHIEDAPRHVELQRLGDQAAIDFITMMMEGIKKANSWHAEDREQPLLGERELRTIQSLLCLGYMDARRRFARQRYYATSRTLFDLIETQVALVKEDYGVLRVQVSIPRCDVIVQHGTTDDRGRFVPYY